MKILIIQLARLGDIYMSWPAMRALRRQHPNAQIDVLTRPRFESALMGLEAIDGNIQFSAADFLEPLMSEVQDSAGVSKSMQKLNQFVEKMSLEKYDWVINLTFSPLSSYLTHAISGEKTKVSGYTRFEDGYFKPADEMSAYFYAQVGVNKKNRVHLSDIFAAMLNLDYIESDWAAPKMDPCNFVLPENYLVVHVGASEKHKTLESAAWISTLKTLSLNKANSAVVLVGAESERIISEQILSQVRGLRIFDLVGKTRVQGLFPIIQGADLLIGCDSAPIHIASLTDTPTLNISLGQVNCWETGPKASLGFILRFEKPTSEKLTLESRFEGNPQTAQVVDFKNNNSNSMSQEIEMGQRIGKVISDLLDGVIDDGLIVRSAGITSYVKEDESLAESFQWNLIQAIYLGAKYPMAESIAIIEGAIKLDDVNKFIIEQLNLVPEIGLNKVAGLIDQAEEVIKTISRLVPEMSPLINWYSAEKIRIAPATPEEVRLATLEVHYRFAQQLQAYLPEEELLMSETSMTKSSVQKSSIANSKAAESLNSESDKKEPCIEEICDGSL